MESSSTLYLLHLSSSSYWLWYLSYKAKRFSRRNGLNVKVCTHGNAIQAVPWAHSGWILGKAYSQKQCWGVGTGCPGSGGVTVSGGAQEKSIYHINRTWLNGHCGGGLGLDQILMVSSNLNDSVIVWYGDACSGQCTQQIQQQPSCVPSLGTILLLASQGAPVEEVFEKSTLWAKLG